MLLVLADGNRRATSSGYAGGARKVVSIAEHLARRADVTTMVACILSPDNIEKRGDRFFAELTREFLRLGAEIRNRGALVGAGVHMDLAGDLGGLRGRGGAARDLADAMEAVAGATRGVAPRALRLVLGVGYGPDTVRDLDADIVLRTGMEEPHALRLSGLRTSERVAALGTTTLWPDIDPREIDEIIDLAKARSFPTFERGYDTAAMAAFARALSVADVGGPWTITWPAAGDAENATVDAGPHELRIVPGSRSKGPDLPLSQAAVLAPGQAAPTITLPGWLALGSANVFGCEATPEGMIEALWRARAFADEHPPLLGGDRVIASVTHAREISSGAGGDRDEMANRFVDKTLAWAASAGLMLEGPEYRTAATSYVLTAFFMSFRLPTAWDREGLDWESRADLAAQYMLLVAVGDEGIFDFAPEGETMAERLRRIEVCSHFLQGALDVDGAEAPRVARAELLLAIRDRWRALFDAHRRKCHPAVAACFRRGLRGHYAGSLSEHRAGGHLEAARGPRAALDSLVPGVEDRFAGAPSSIAARARALARSAGEGSSSASCELRALTYLVEAGAAIAAGLLFRTAALAAPASCVTEEAVAALDAAATIIDYHFRISNDLATFLDSPSGDRDAKDNALTILIPEGLSGEARASATVEALATGQRLASWLEEEEGAHAARVAELWPWMGKALRRAVFVGRRVYELGHYTTLSREAMSAIFDEAERDPRMR